MVDNPCYTISPVGEPWGLSEFQQADWEFHLWILLLHIEQDDLNL